MKRLIGILTLLIVAAVANATPSISSISGTPGNGNALTINGANLGTHPSSTGGQKPTVFADFEGGTVNPDGTLGKLSAWSDSNCMVATDTVKAEGNWSIYGYVGDGCQVEARLTIPISWTVGGYLVAHVHRRNDNDSDTSENWKVWRAGESTGGNIFPDWYIGHAPGAGAFQMSVEQCGNSFNTFFPYVWPYQTFIEDSVFLYRGTSEYAQDGWWKSRQNMVVNGSSSTYRFNCVANADVGPYDNFNIQDDISNDREGNSGKIYYDYVYIDTQTPNYVMFTNASTIASSTKGFIQPYSAMTGTSTTITQKFADLGSNTSNIYVYACVNGDDCSSGVQLSSGSGGSGGGSSTPSTTGVLPWISTH